MDRGPAAAENRCATDQKGNPMSDSTVTLTLSKADAEVLLGVLSSERYNQDVEAVCNQIRQQLDEKLAELA